MFDPCCHTRQNELPKLSTKHTRKLAIFFYAKLPGSTKRLLGNSSELENSCLPRAVPDDTTSTTTTNDAE